MKGNFENTLLLVKFIMRRERIISAVWILFLALAVIGLVPGMKAAIDENSLDSLLPMLEMPAMVSMIGPAYASAYGTFGAFYTTMMMLFTALTVGLMNIFLVVRYTRADEERGRYEVVRSLPVGRLANLNAAMLSALIVNVLLFLIIGFGMFVFGDETMSFNGSMLWGASLAATGLVFAAVTALSAQLSSSSRGAAGYSFAALFVFYLLRAPGDMNPELEFLSLVSPLGLVLRTQAYMDNYWLPVFFMLAIALIISAIAYRLNYSRDIDRGLIPSRAGRAYGSVLMRSPLGLAFRLLKVSLIVWTAGMFVLAASYASILGEVDDFIAENEMYQQLILGPAGIDFETMQSLPSEQKAAMMKEMVSHAGFTMAELFSAMVNSMMGMVTLVPLLIFVLKVKSEEKDIRAELLLAAPVCRKKYMAGYAFIAFGFAIVVQIVLALGMYSVAVSILPDPSELSLMYLLRANLVYVPAQWVIVGAAVLLVGFIPRAAGAIWGYFAYTFFIIFIGRIGIFPEWLSKLTPMGYVPQLPMDEISFPVMAALTAIAAGMTAAGLFFYNRRDINAVTH
ncbi:MAG: hypothetical protein FWH24_00320 [Oscillospiraceae bacterium]|nr:hypothetical protein [Oscillospiraceae bacterium]